LAQRLKYPSKNRASWSDSYYYTFRQCVRPCACVGGQGRVLHSAVQDVPQVQCSPKGNEAVPSPEDFGNEKSLLDDFIRVEVLTAIRNTVKALSRLQSLVLDSVSPLTHLLKADLRGGTPIWEETKKAVLVATKYNSNAGVKTTNLRCEKVTE